MNRERNRGFYALFVTLGVAAIIVLLVIFSMSVEKYTERTMETSLEEIRDNAIFVLNNELDQVTEMLNNEARAFSLLENTSPDAIVGELQAFSRNISIARIMAMTMDGKVYSSVGEPVRQYDPAQYTAFLTRDETSVSEPRYSKTLDKTVVAVFSPLHLNGTQSGMLIGEYDIAYFENLFSKNFLRGDCAINLATADGQLISRSGAFDAPEQFGKGNIFDFYSSEDVTFDKGSSEELKQKMGNGESGYASYTTEGVSRYVSYAPVGINDWYIAAVTTQKTLGSQVTAIRTNALWLVAGIVGVVLVTVLAISLLRIREERSLQAYLFEMARTDSLTGLYNKSATAEAIDTYLKEEGAEGQHMLLMLDIDGFKAVNDLLGHLYGDAVLREFGVLLTDTFDADNILGRAGGDEFMVFVKNCGSRGQIAGRASHVCEAFDTVRCPDTKAQELCVRTSVSIGIAVYPADGRDFDALYHSADTALYVSKRKGENQYNFYEAGDGRA